MENIVISGYIQSSVSDTSNPTIKRMSVYVSSYSRKNGRKVRFYNVFMSEHLGEHVKKAQPRTFVVVSGRISDVSMYNETTNITITATDIHIPRNRGQEQQQIEPFYGWGEDSKTVNIDEVPF